MLINNNKVNEIIELVTGEKIRSNKLLILNELNTVKDNKLIITNQNDFLTDEDRKMLDLKYSTKIAELEMELRLLESVSKNKSLVKKKFTGDVNGKQILLD